VNCSALPESLLESELFGHVRGAFTGAVQSRRGLFEEAAGGTLFLDEISTISPAIQVKLLRVLQERAIKRVGGREAIQVDFRLLAATNADLSRLVSAGDFREDLFYRLNVFPIWVPPLRERKEDLPLLANHFRLRFAKENGLEPPGLSDETLARMAAYGWPGNIRELENFVERSVIMYPGARTIPFELPTGESATAEETVLAEATEGGWDLDHLEREYILRVLDQVQWHQGAAAKILGVNRRTLYPCRRSKRRRPAGCGAAHDGRPRLGA
jgi:transcriptional regulator with GAF, ATPase, and Fis domain